MIRDPLPGNDEECLGQFVKVARELAQTTLMQTAGRQFQKRAADARAARLKLIDHIRSLPQLDDAGNEVLQGGLECDVWQRLRILPPDPNCVERALIAIVLLEIIDPQTERAPFTLDEPVRHTGIVELINGEWKELNLFPRSRPFGIRNSWLNTTHSILGGVENYGLTPVLKFYLGDKTGGAAGGLIGKATDAGFSLANKPKQPTAPSAPSGAAVATVAPQPAPTTTATNQPAPGGTPHDPETESYDQAPNQAQPAKRRWWG